GQYEQRRATDRERRHERAVLPLVALAGHVADDLLVDHPADADQRLQGREDQLRGQLGEARRGIGGRVAVEVLAQPRGGLALYLVVQVGLRVGGEGGQAVRLGLEYRHVGQVR